MYIYITDHISFWQVADYYRVWYLSSIDLQTYKIFHSNTKSTQVISINIYFISTILVLVQVVVALAVLSHITHANYYHEYDINYYSEDDINYYVK